jgi:hypothetical protein
MKVKLCMDCFCYDRTNSPCTECKKNTDKLFWELNTDVVEEPNKMFYALEMQDGSIEKLIDVDIIRPNNLSNKLVLEANLQDHTSTDRAVDCFL